MNLSRDDDDDAALAAKVLQVQYQRTVINTHLAYHQNEFPPHEREFWDWYQGEYLPGYHDIYGDAHSGASHGDPHVATHDELAIDLESVGEFVLIRSTIDDLELQARHRPFFDSRSVSVNSAIAVRLEGERLVVDAYDSIPVRLDGRPLEMDTDVRQISDEVSVYRDDPKTYLFSNRTGVLVKLDYWSGAAISLHVGLPAAYQGNVEGIFGDSWRISQSESLFDYPEGETTQDYTDRSFPERPVDLASYPDERREWAERTCREAGVQAGRLLDDCIYDLLVTGDERFARGAAALSAPASGPSEGDTAEAFTPLDRCLALPCDRAGDEPCSGFAGVVCDVRRPDEPDEERLCVAPGGQCDRDDQCCGFSGCVDGTCASRTEGQTCVTSRNCADGLLCGFDEPRRCYDPDGG
ncbi:MAG: EB domain-containing protein [Gemmatimonadota bacterium]